MGCEKTTNDVIKFSYHFLLYDAQPDFFGSTSNLHFQSSWVFIDFVEFNICKIPT